MTTEGESLPPDPPDDDVMTAEDRRHLEAIEMLTALDRDAGVAVTDVQAAMQPEAGEIQTRLARLWETQHIVFSEDEVYLTITPKGLSVLGIGEPGEAGPDTPAG